MKLTWKAASEEDIEPLFQLNRDLTERYDDLTAIDLPKVLDWVRSKLEAHIGEYTRVEGEGKTVGYFRLVPKEDKLEMDDLYVLPGYRGQGIGTAILTECIRRADRPIFLYVFTGNKRAIALYTRIGFRVREQAGAIRYIMERQPD